MKSLMILLLAALPFVSSVSPTGAEEPDIPAIAHEQMEESNAAERKTLTGLRRVRISYTILIGFKKNHLNEAAIRKAVQSRLTEAGLEVVPDDEAHAEDAEFSVSIGDLIGPGISVFISLKQPALLKRDSKIQVSATTYEREFHKLGSDNTLSRVDDIVSRFAAQWMIANRHP